MKLYGSYRKSIDKWEEKLDMKGHKRLVRLFHKKARKVKIKECCISNQINNTGDSENEQETNC